MKWRKPIFFLLLLAIPAFAAPVRGNATPVKYIYFYGDTIRLPQDSLMLPAYTKPISSSSIRSFYEAMESSHIQGVIDSILSYKRKQALNDWIYYHLIRATAEALSPKAQNYERYTLFKWYILNKSGYASLLSITPAKMLLYVQSDDEVFEIPVRMHDGKQYVCLNYHDYGEIDFNKETFEEAGAGFTAPGTVFSYKIDRLPDFSSQRYVARELEFDYYQRDYKFKILVNPDVQKIFANYPVLNYSYYFSMPMSRVTYSSLIPLLKKYLYKTDKKKGVDYLMHFTRYTFSFETDTRQFGKEKRLTPEQTLLYDRSDCEDRAAFFFYLVKEIYALPMIVLSYPDHVTVAVNFGKKLNKHAIRYKGADYYICEPTPQATDLGIGDIPPALQKAKYEVVYEYNTSAVPAD